MSKTTKPNFQELIAEYLSKGAVTADSLADHLQVTWRTVYRWKAGDTVPTDPRLFGPLAKVMGISTGDLIDAMSRK